MTVLIASALAIAGRKASNSMPLSAMSTSIGSPAGVELSWNSPLTGMTLRTK